MAELQQVIKTIMLDLLDARQQAQRLSRDIGEQQLKDPILSLMPVPGIRIDAIDLNLKFVVQTDGSDNSASPEFSKQRQTTITELSNKTASALLSDPQLKKLLPAAPPELSKTLQQQLRSSIDEKTFRLQSDTLSKSLATSLAPHLQNKLNPDKLISGQLALLEKELQQQAVRQLPQAGSKLLVDSTTLSKVNADHISSVSLKLSLDDYEWKSMDEQDRLTPVR